MQSRCAGKPLPLCGSVSGLVNVSHQVPGCALDKTQMAVRLEKLKAEDNDGAKFCLTVLNRDNTKVGFLADIQ